MPVWDQGRIDSVTMSTSPRSPVPQRPTPRRRDLDLDSSSHPSSIPLDAPPEAYLRIVANPFLGFGWFLAVFLGLAFAFQGHLPFEHETRMTAFLVVVFLLFSLFAAPRVVHYHCLDCGATGRLTRWRQHLCPRVAERRLLRQPRRVRGPAPRVQVFLWLWFFAIVLIIAMR
jgi:hypothetical protein